MKIGSDPVAPWAKWSGIGTLGLSLVGSIVYAGVFLGDLNGRLKGLEKGNATLIGEAKQAIEESSQAAVERMDQSIREFLEANRGDRPTPTAVPVRGGGPWENLPRECPNNPMPGVW